MKYTLKTVRTLAATLIAFGTLAGGAQAALSLTFDESSGNTVVTLTAINFTTIGLTPASAASSSTFINPSFGHVAFTGSTDTGSSFDTAFAIPAFSFGTGSIDSAATNLGANNPFFALFPGGGYGVINFRSSNPSNSDFVATATYSGNLLANGINPSPQIITFDNGQTLSISAVPEPSLILIFGISFVSFVIRRHRIR